MIWKQNGGKYLGRENFWLISKCLVDGCGDVFVVNRRNMHKPLDDLRILHLQKDHGMKNQIRLENHFEELCRMKQREFNEFMMNCLGRK